MVNIIKRFIRLLYKFGYIQKIYTVTFHGKPFSLNDIYSGGNDHGSFFRRKNLKDKYTKIFLEEIKRARVGRINSFFLLVLYNSRHDVDNVSGMVKVFVDTLKDKKDQKMYTENDGRYVFKGMLILYDKSLAHNQFTFNILKDG